MLPRDMFEIDRAMHCTRVTSHKKGRMPLFINLHAELQYSVRSVQN